MISIGFTGTRHGMSPAQYSAVRSVMHAIVMDDASFDAHHGDCVGADSEFHQICELFSSASARIVIHPGPITGLSAGHEGAERLPCRPYKARNRDIVNASTVMIAAPYEDDERYRGGTWGTIRMTHAAAKPLAIAYRSGRAALYHGGRVVREVWP